MKLIASVIGFNSHTLVLPFIAGEMRQQKKKPRDV